MVLDGISVVLDGMVCMVWYEKGIVLSKSYQQQVSISRSLFWLWSRRRHLLLFIDRRACLERKVWKSNTEGDTGMT
jgi:hypothetical protein